MTRPYSHRAMKILEALNGPAETRQDALTALQTASPALAYVGALHPSQQLREAAIRLLDDPFCLLMAGNSSPFRESVEQCFEKLGRMIVVIEGDILLWIMLCAPAADVREKAYKKLKKAIKAGKIFTLLEGFATLNRYLSELNGGEGVEIYEGVRTEKRMEELRDSPRLITDKELEGRRKAREFSSDELLGILDKQPT